MSESLVVYTLPSCVQCESTKRLLQRKEISFEEVDLSKNPEAMEMVRSLGYTQAPVVVLGQEHWSGFRIERLNALSA